MKRARNAFRRCAIWTARLVGSVVFDRKYLEGRHFQHTEVGWRWVLRGIWFQKILGFNRSSPWPQSPRSTVSVPANLHFHPDDLNNLRSPGCYFQNFDAHIVIGRGTYIAPNVGIITSNHDPADLDRHKSGADVILGERCWIGMNAVVLPGVILGDATIVGAGAVVTRSFPEGNCTIVGNPARLVVRDVRGEGPAPTRPGPS